MITITVKNGNICEISGPLAITHKLYKEFRIKHPNAWHIQMYQRGSNKWDGYISYISERGNFRIGLLPTIIINLFLGEKRLKLLIIGHL